MLADTHAVEADAGRQDAGRAVTRLCVVTREPKPVDALMRFVLAPDGTVVPDLKRRLPGRGVWVSAERGVVATAVKRRVFGKALKADAKAPLDLPDLTGRLLARHALDALAMAHKAGCVALGFSRVEDALATENVAALIEASDASPDGTRKIRAAALRAQGEGTLRIPIVARFTSAQLDLAFGRSNVVHAALLGGPASESFLGRWRRLEHYMGADGASASDAKTGSPEGRD